MPIQNYNFEYSINGVAWFGIGQFQDFQITIGRQKQLDPIKASTASFSVWYPQGYSSPDTGLVPGCFIRVSNVTTYLGEYYIWYGRITDLIANYGIPYESGYGAADTLQITAEGTFASMGRMQGLDYAMGRARVVEQTFIAAGSTLVDIAYLPDSTTTELAATTISGTWGDWVGRVCQSTNSRLWDGLDTNQCRIISPFSNFVGSVNFSDVANNATNQVYSQINFDSMADNYYTQVRVDPESFAPVTVTAAGAVSPFRTYETNTLSVSTGQATDYGNYLLNNYSDPKLGISSVTCIAEAQSSFQLDKLGFENAFAKSPGTQVSVTFRGTVYQCIIEGVTMSASPAGASYTFHLSDADMNSYLILNNAVYGKLDENRLAY
jgi:hypothetical protein